MHKLFTDVLTFVNYIFVTIMYRFIQCFHMTLLHDRTVPVRTKICFNVSHWGSETLKMGKTTQNKILFCSVEGVEPWPLRFGFLWTVF